jgi:DNA-binding CsgD family transcriptional regulator
MTARFCSKQCNADALHSTGIARNRFIAMCLDQSTPTDPIDLSPDTKVIDQLSPEIREATWLFLKEIASVACTKKQIRIVELYFEDGLTQNEIAVKLKLNQSSVHKTLYGIKVNSNQDKARKYLGKYYGGAIRGIRKMLGREPCLTKLQATLAG